jgi:hypothetical protein
MPSRDEPTPISHRHSGEWPEWAGLLLDQTNRIEKSVGRLTADFADHLGDDKVMREHVDQLREKQKRDDEDSRQMSIGTKLAILSAVISPFVVILFEVMRARP